VVVAINYSQAEQRLNIAFKNMWRIKTIRSYVTTAAEQDNMKASAIVSVKDGVMLPARSITTVVIN
jgi:O-glycosyl hydrolase